MFDNGRQRKEASIVRNILIAGLCLTLVEAAWGSGVEMRIFDALHHREYKSAYERMVHGQPHLPAFMSSVRAAMGGSGSPGTTEIVDGRPRQLFHFCEPHNCGHVAAVVFAPGLGASAKAAISTDNPTLGPPSKGPIRFLGNPDEDEKRALSAALDR